MADRKPIVGGNWKMNLHGEEARQLVDGLVEKLGREEAVDVAVFPPHPYLQQTGQQICQANAALRLGAQDVYPEPNGAFTGEVSCSMLKDVGCAWVLTGHSERRHVIGEDDRLVNRKTRAALDAGLNVVLCVGETLDQREAGQTDAVNLAQVTGGLEGVDASEMDRIVIAYEPVWAIGTGKTATPDDAQSAHRSIREAVANLYDQRVADALQIQYGGSCKAKNAAELFAQPDVDGGLIGGASLKVDEFAAIIEAAKSKAAA